MKLSLHQDIPAFRKLWEFKALTTSALLQIAYPKTSQEYGYRRLIQLEKKKYIQAISSRSGERFIWILQKKGFEVIRDWLGDLKEEGFKSEHLSHDVIASAFQIGNLIKNTEISQITFTEQQLRRIDLNNYPSWIPKDDRRRPDGYWRFNIDGKYKVVALEVELSQKSHDEYYNVGTFYDQTSEIDQVVWLVPNHTVANYIHKRLQKVEFNRSSCHSFISKKDFLTLGWQCPIHLGKDYSKMFKDLFLQSTSIHYSEPDWSKLTDFRKYPITTKPYNPPLEEDFFY